MLRQESPEEQGKDSGLPAAQELSPDELSEVLNEAIARQAGSEQHTSDVATLQDALEIARQINVPEEHVVAAAAALRRRKEEATLAVRREEKRALVRQGRKYSFLASMALAVVAAGAALALNLFGLVWVAGLVAATVLLAVYQGARWLSLPVSDREADQLELPPAAGTCRVCGAPAHTPRATFCEEHRYKGPTA